LSFFILFVQSLSIAVTEQPKAPAVRTVRTEQTSISLSWEVSKTCFELVASYVSTFPGDLPVTRSRLWGAGYVYANISRNSYDITSLTPGMSYHITLVAYLDLPLTNAQWWDHGACCLTLAWRAGLIRSRKGCTLACWCIRCTSGCGILSWQ